MSKRLGDPGYAPGWCIHYRASSALITTCEAGVPFDRWRQTKFDQRPCFLDKQGRSKPGASPCEHLRCPTPEEIAAHERWVAMRWESLSKVLAAIAPWRAEQVKRRRSASQVIDCPACGGKKTLQLSISGHNGHVHGNCETEGCVSWME